MDGMKRCSKCGEVKALEEFHRSKTGTHGRHAYCRACCKAYSARRNPEKYQAARDGVIRRAVEWQRANPERYRARLRKWQERNRPRLLHAKRCEVMQVTIQKRRVMRGGDTEASMEKRVCLDLRVPNLRSEWKYRGA